MNSHLVLCHTLMFGLSTCRNCGDQVTFVVGQPEFLEPKALVPETGIVYEFKMPA